MLKTLPNDIQYSFRMLRKRPGFAALAVVTLALGVGANTAIFSVVNAVLLRPLAFKDPARLVAIESINPSSGKEQTSGVSPADFWDWTAQSQFFESLATYSGTGVSFPTDP
ncbi:MAG TPA: ABC transporter permease, partial [Blastocatellia bacterium]|nr:ABC transporter permease [Blastocatellia bacterium]